MRRLAFPSFLALALCAAAHAQYAARVTVASGNAFVVQNLDIRGDRLYHGDGESSTGVSMIKNVEFRFSGVGLPMCERMFRLGDRKALESLLEENVGPVARFAYLPGNLGDYLGWLLRVQYWNGNLEGARKTVGQLRQTNNPRFVELASLYFSLVLLDQGQPEDARAVFGSVENPDGISKPMAEYIRGRFALEDREYRKAMRHAAQIVAFHSRDAEWMPPATALEAEIYLQTGQWGKARTVAEELMLAYPGTSWEKQGETIKREATANLGG